MPKLSEIIIEVKQIERKIVLKQSELKDLQTRLNDLTGQDISFDGPEQIDEGQHQVMAPKKAKREKKVVEPSETKAKTNDFCE